MSFVSLWPKVLDDDNTSLLPTKGFEAVSCILTATALNFQGFAYSGTVPTLQAKLKKPQNMLRAITGATFLMTIIYIVIAVCGLLALGERRLLQTKDNDYLSALTAEFMEPSADGADSSEMILDRNSIENGVSEDIDGNTIEYDYDPLTGITTATKTYSGAILNQKGVISLIVNIFIAIQTLINYPLVLAPLCSELEGLLGFVYDRSDPNSRGKKCTVFLQCILRTTLIGMSLLIVYLVGGQLTHLITLLGAIFITTIFYIFPFMSLECLKKREKMFTKGLTEKKREKSSISLLGDGDEEVKALNVIGKPIEEAVSKEGLRFCCFSRTAQTFVHCVLGIFVVIVGVISAQATIKSLAEE